jgi:cell division septum initiation protein DivIVA
LNNRILALYDQIERVTLENLEVAQKNSELEVQIKTIDEVITTRPFNSSINTPSSHDTASNITEQYGQLLKEHIQLANRVAQIEELLFSGSAKQTFLAKAGTQSTVNKVPSIQDLMRSSRKKTVGKAKMEKTAIGLASSRKNRT